MLRNYLVTAHVHRHYGGSGSLTTEHFVCEAEDASHAIEQARSNWTPHRIVVLSVVITH